jgi:hypothetical protein
MEHELDETRNPGEARNRARQRRRWAFLIFAGLVGAVIGALLSGLENGEGNFLVGQIETLTMPAWAAIAMAAAFFFALAVLPVWGFTQIDDYQMRHNLIGYAGGCIAAVAGYPIWAVLAMGGLVPHPTAFGIFVIAFAATMLTFLAVKLRG